MTFREDPIVIPCQGETLQGVMARPDTPSTIGVVIVVGGPQTRVGSHRQFLLLARALASCGYPTLRFDYRGMGDSTGKMRDFLAVDDDIAAAVGVLCAHHPSVERVVLWGLCDAASAALLYWHRRRDERLAGMCLLNPWVRSDASLARTRVQHYYGKRLLDRAFWLKLLRGGIDIPGAIRGFARNLRLAAGTRAGNEEVANIPFQAAMAAAWQSFPGEILLILSGNDYTAKEFITCLDSDPAWRGALGHQHRHRRDVPDADHTFSSHAWRQTVETMTLEWISTLTVQTSAGHPAGA